MMRPRSPTSKISRIRRCMCQVVRRSGHNVIRASMHANICRIALPLRMLLRYVVTYWKRAQQTCLRNIFESRSRDFVSAMPDTALQQIFALVPSTVTRYREFALRILLHTLRGLPETAISWWASEEECEEDSAMITARHPRLEGAIGSIDGLNILLATSDDPDLENATYNGWLHGHYTSCVIVFSPKGMCQVLPFKCKADDMY